MANESTFALISALLPDIWEGALFYLEENFLMPQLVRTFSDRTGMVPRKVSEYEKTTTVQDSLAETTDLTPVEFDRNLLSTLTPKEIGKMHIITDRRMESEDVADIMADSARDLGFSLGLQVERDLLGLFSSLTGAGSGVSSGDVQTAMSISRLIHARTVLEDSLVSGPYVAVISPFQYLDIYDALTDLTAGATFELRNRALQQYYVGQISDLSIFVDNSIQHTRVQQVNTITITDHVAGDTYTITLNGQTTSAIAGDATAAAIETALEALSNVVDGDLVVAGSAEGPYTITFQAGGNFDAIDVVLTVDATLMDSSGTSDATIAVTTPASISDRGAVFTRDALAFDLRRGLRIEPDRDPSARWSELNATMVYAHGVWRPTHGIPVLSDASNPLTGA